MFANYGYLAEFLVAAESPNLAAASKRLLISPAAMSKHLAALESELECELLERDRHTFRLTPAGQAVYNAGAPLLAIGPQVEAAARQATPLRIMVLFDSVSLHQAIARATRALTRAGRGINIELEEAAGTRNPFTTLTEGDIDLLIHDPLGCQAVPEELESHAIAKMSYIGIVRTCHPLARRRELFIDDLRDWPLIRLNGNFQLLEHTWNAICAECMAAGFRPVEHDQTIYHPAGGGLVDISDNEIYIVSADSQNVSSFRDDPEYACIGIAGFQHEAQVSFLPDNARAKAFYEAICTQA